MCDKIKYTETMVKQLEKDKCVKSLQNHFAVCLWRLIGKDKVAVLLTSDVTQSFLVGIKLIIYKK